MCKPSLKLLTDIVLLPPTTTTLDAVDEGAESRGGEENEVAVVEEEEVVVVVSFAFIPSSLFSFALHFVAFSSSSCCGGSGADVEVVVVVADVVLVLVVVVCSFPSLASPSSSFTWWARSHLVYFQKAYHPWSRFSILSFSFLCSFFQALT